MEKEETTCSIFSSSFSFFLKTGLVQLFLKLDFFLALAFGFPFPADKMFFFLLELVFYSEVRWVFWVVVQILVIGGPKGAIHFLL